MSQYTAHEPPQYLPAAQVGDGAGPDEEHLDEPADDVRPLGQVVQNDEPLLEYLPLEQLEHAREDVLQV